MCQLFSVASPDTRSPGRDSYGRDRVGKGESGSGSSIVAEMGSSFFLPNLANRATFANADAANAAESTLESSSDFFLIG